MLSVATAIIANGALQTIYMKLAFGISMPLEQLK